MRRPRNPGCVFTGLVGSRSKPRLFRNRQPRAKQHRITLIGGPLHRCDAWLTIGADTLPIVLHGKTGQYITGRWFDA